jgi:putative flippase GtrA
VTPRGQSVRATGTDPSRVHDTLLKLSRYFLTGGAAAVVDAGGFSLLYYVGVATLPAAIASFTIAAIVNFVLTARFVFGQRPSGHGFTLFFLAALVGLTVNVGVTLAAVELLGLPPVIAKIVGIGTAFSLNFLLNLLIVFRAKETQ